MYRNDMITSRRRYIQQNICLDVGYYKVNIIIDLRCNMFLNLNYNNHQAIYIIFSHTS